MATKKITYAEIMKMKEADFLAFVEAKGHKEQVKEIASLESEQKVYPRVKVWNEEKGKYTYKADKTQTPKIVIRPITFFELKTTYAEKVLKLEKAAPKNKDNFRSRIAKW